MQEAVGRALVQAHEPFEGCASYYAWLIAEYTRKREILYRGLRAAGLPPVETEGSFFIMADTSAIVVPEKYLYPNGRDAPPAPRDYAFCRFLTTEIGVAAIPVRSGVGVGIGGWGVIILHLPLTFFAGLLGAFALKSHSISLFIRCFPLLLGSFFNRLQPSAFMSDENKHHVANYARFAFCKKDETLNAAVAKLARLADFRKKPAEL
jgi:aspartate/methionine/tyrosine aminotransferase